ncbi:MAG: nucleotidyltransferase family protein [Pseudomonadales bacterium]|jgi:MurNAc alpha-1-phosphate uridylyltransferase|nr:nucleotidyltransferase family protein [Pseudomonadales bacterium]
MTIETAMILAAGRGSRLRPLTDRTPKPLLEVRGRTLIEHHLVRLAAAGIHRVVVNLHHLGEAIRARVGDGQRYGLEVRYAPEPVLLETAGGIIAALPLLAEDPFLVVNGDVLCDLDFTGLTEGPGDALAHLVMVPNPAWREGGDFDLADGDAERARLVARPNAGLTYAGIGSYRAALFAGWAPGPRPLRPVLDAAIAEGRITGEIHRGRWDDIGTVARLAAARADED